MIVKSKGATTVLDMSFEKLPECKTQSSFNARDCPGKVFHLSKVFLCFSSAAFPILAADVATSKTMFVCERGRAVGGLAGDVAAPAPAPNSSSASSCLIDGDDVATLQ